MFRCTLAFFLLGSPMLFGGSLFEPLRNLPPGLVGEKYGVPLQGDGADSCSTPGVTWQVVAGKVPAGMRLIDGKLAGRPETTGKWEFAVRASTACSDKIVPIRIAVADGVIQADLISVQSRSRSR